LTLSGPVTLGGTGGQRIFQGSNNLTVSGLIGSGASTVGGVVKLGTGTLVLQNTANTFTNGISIQNGTLRVTKLSDRGTASSIGANATAALQIGQQGNTSTLEYVGTGDTVDLQVAIGNGDGTGGATILNNGSGALVFSNSMFNVAPGSGSTSETRALTLGGTNTGANEIRGVIANNTTQNKTTRVVKSGTGTWILSGANTYGGATTVSAGSLIINGNQSGATGLLTVAQNATLGGSGTIGGATTISGNLQPGNSPGILTFSSGLTLTGTAVTTMEINGLARGTDYDVINVVGGLLTYDGRLTLSLSGPVYGIGIYSFDLFDFVSQTGSFDVVELLGSYSGSLTNNGSGVWGLSSGNDTWSFSQADGVLTLDVVPEPSTYALLVLSAAGLAAHVVRRRRRLPR
jgi:autotransporter-associated beta strand protein